MFDQLHKTGKRLSKVSPSYARPEQNILECAAIENGQLNPMRFAQAVPAALEVRSEPLRMYVRFTPKSRHRSCRENVTATVT